MSSFDYAVMALYVATVMGIGLYFARQQAAASDYFLGRHEIPWWAAMMSIVATETSALTVISVPGIAAFDDLRFLQIPLGYIVGRTVVAWLLLPGYFEGEQMTAYQRLETRFGPTTRRLASAVFMVIRSLGDSVRVFATAIPVALVTGWSPVAAIIFVAVATLFYTWWGGIKAVIWVDVLQLILYLAAGAAAIAIVGSEFGLAETFGRAAESGKFTWLDFSLTFTEPYTFLAGVIGGALLSAASHGTDHLMVQRLLSTKDLSSARKALVGSGVVVFVQFALFLIVGAVIWSTGTIAEGAAGDEVFPQFVIDHFPSGLAGLVVAGILAAAMSTVSSSLNSLASASSIDFYAPITGRNDPKHLLGVGRLFTVVWAVVLSAGALSFSSSDQPVVVLALSIASITYGSLLATYILSSVRRITGIDINIGLLVGCVAMSIIVLAKPGPFGSLAWPWYVPLGILLTSTTAFTSSVISR